MKTAQKVQEFTEGANLSRSGPVGVAPCSFKNEMVMVKCDIMFTQKIGLAEQISVFGPDYTTTVSVRRLQKRPQQARVTLADTLDQPFIKTLVTVTITALLFLAVYNLFGACTECSA